LLRLNLAENFISTYSSPGGQTEKIAFTRLDEDNAQKNLNKPQIAQRVLLKCPRCEANIQQYYKRNTTDGTSSVTYADYQCSDATCGLNIESSDVTKPVNTTMLGACIDGIWSCGRGCVCNNWCVFVQL
jgi:hypothetical protein